MELGMIGLGRMGSNLTRRLLRAGHDVVVHDRDALVVAELAGEGARGAASLEELVAMLTPPRAVWVMVPAEVTGRVIDDLAGCLRRGDLIVDGGNTFYRDDFRRAANLQAVGLELVDVGTSGGIYGLDRGFCLMVGGSPTAVERLEPILRCLASGVDAAERTDPNRGEIQPAENGYLHCGPTGAGHFAKMVHNGIEYGMMAAYAEGLSLFQAEDAGSSSMDDEPGEKRFERMLHQHVFDVASIAEVWRRGSVISSWLLDLTATAIGDDASLSQHADAVADSGEGRWVVQTAVEKGVPMPAITSALYGRFASRGRDTYANRVQSAMRSQFGGHD